MNERREKQRLRTFKGAKAAFGDFRFTYDCVVRNLSPTGASVQCEHAGEFPDAFYLFDPNTRALHPAEVIWRKEQKLGVRFVGQPVSVAQSDDPRHARFRFL
jgi:hypothetical protein